MTRLMTWKRIVPLASAAALMVPATGCLGGGGDGNGDGSGGGFANAGVPNTTLVNDLTMEQTVSLCMHFDAVTDFDISRPCCVGRAIEGAEAGAGACEDLLADCEADPSTFGCDSGDGEPSNCEGETPPECTGDPTVGQLAACLEDFSAEVNAVFDGLDCDTTMAEIEALSNSEPEMPASCETVMKDCPDVFSEESSSSGSSSGGQPSSGDGSF